MDEYFPIPPRPVDKPFLMPIEDVFSISGRGTVVTGRVAHGRRARRRRGARSSASRTPARPSSRAWRCSTSSSTRARRETTSARLLRGIEKDDVERGQVLAKPGSITPHKKFKCTVVALTKEEGGRHSPFFTGYRPQFYFRTTDVTASVTLPEGKQMVMPGDNVTDLTSRADLPHRHGQGACSSPSARAARPSAPGRSRTSSSRTPTGRRVRRAACRWDAAGRRSHGTE